MTINNLKCPSCGSTPKYNKDTMVYVCSYCGAELSRDFSIKPKKEIIDRIMSLGIEDFWEKDYEHSYRKFVNALYYDKNNVCLKYYKEITDILRLFLPDLDLSWDKAYTLLKEINNNNLEEKHECLKMFLFMTTYTFDNLLKKSSDDELKKESCVYAYDIFNKLYNEMELTKKEKLDFLNKIKELIDKIIYYYETHNINALDMKEQLNNIQIKINTISNDM